MTGLSRRFDTSSAVSLGLLELAALGEPLLITLGLTRASLERVEQGLSPDTGRFSFICLRGVRACLEGDTSVSFSRGLESPADRLVASLPGVSFDLLGVFLLTVFLFDLGVLIKRIIVFTLWSILL